MSEKPQEGNWTLVSPDGRTFVAESPIRCCRREMGERIPAEVRAKRLIDFLNEQEGHDED